MKNVVCAIILLGIYSSDVFADWSLDSNASHISFISVKALDIAEVHSFGIIDGEISDKGKAAIAIDLASVDTGIPIRNERMMTLLFNTEEFPLADVRAKLDKGLLQDLQPGQTIEVDVELELNLHGTKLPIETTLSVARLSETALTVSSIRPLIVNAASVGLSAGVEELRKIANLPSISGAVPVSFVLKFVR